jgi:hypothetical protein
MRQSDSNRPDEHNDRPTTASRRRFLTVASIGAPVAAAIALAPRTVRSVLQHTAGIAPPAADTTQVLNTTVAFIATLFGRRLTAEDHTELLDRLSYATQREPVRREYYDLLCQYLDRAARSAGFASFDAADSTGRTAIVDRIMRTDVSPLLSRLLSLVSADTHQLRRIKLAVVPQLAWLYRHSGVPWRARGYTRWPGIPGDWHEYLTDGRAYP